MYWLSPAVAVRQMWWLTSQAAKGTTFFSVHRVRDTIVLPFFSVLKNNIRMRHSKNSMEYWSSFPITELDA